MIDEVKYIIGFLIVILIVFVSFFPLNLFIPEGFWIFIPDILLNYPLAFIVSQLIPAIFWFTFFIIGFMMIRRVILD